MARGRPIDEGGHVPGAADDGDPLMTRAFRGADLTAHRRLAEFVEWVLVGELRSDGDHRLADCLEHIRGGAAGLDEAVPPALAVGLAGGSGELAEGVGADRGREVSWFLRGFFGLVFVFFPKLSQQLFTLRAPARELKPDAEIDEPNRNARLKPMADRLPLWAEDREREERPVVRLVGVVDEERDRRPHLLVRRERNERIGVGWPLDEDAIRREAPQILDQAPRRTRPVVPDPEDGDAHRLRDPPIRLLVRLADQGAGGQVANCPNWGLVRPLARLADHEAVERPNWASARGLVRPLVRLADQGRGGSNRRRETTPVAARCRSSHLLAPSRARESPARARAGLNVRRLLPAAPG